MRFRIFLIKLLLNTLNVFGIFNFWGAVAGGLASGLASGVGAKGAAEAQAGANRYGTDVNAQLSREQLEAQKRLTGYTSEQQKQLADAYRNAYQTQQNNYNTGQSNLQALFSKTPAELETLKQQALTGQAKELQQGTSQLQAGLAQAGVRGGQAATQLRRGVGEMTDNASKNIQALIANEAMQRAGEQRQYTAQQQQAIQNFLLNPQSAQYSQQTTPEQARKLEELMKNYLNSGNVQNQSNGGGRSGSSISDLIGLVSPGLGALNKLF